MIKMMIAFIRDYFRYKQDVKRHDKWIKKYARIKGYDLNPNKMLYVNLKIWLAEMEGIYGKRYCPCFDPSGNKKRDQKMICPCKYIDAEIEEYGSCHCSLFGKPGMNKKEWKESADRLMGEYRVKLNLKGNVLDTRGMPMDKHRNLPIPDASHQLKSTLLNFKGKELKMIVATEQETINLEKIAKFKGYDYNVEPYEDGAFMVKLRVR